MKTLLYLKNVFKRKTKNLIQYANILKDITIIGVLNKIEIWDNATLEKSDSKQIIDEDSYEELSKRVNI